MNRRTCTVQIVFDCGKVSGQDLPSVVREGIDEVIDILVVRIKYIAPMLVDVRPALRGVVETEVHHLDPGDGVTMGN